MGHWLGPGGERGREGTVFSSHLCLPKEYNYMNAHFFSPDISRTPDVSSLIVLLCASVFVLLIDIASVFNVKIEMKGS